MPQIRYATPERLLERLTDLRFLSIDFLNTFLLTYRVFTDGVTVLDALKKVFYATAEMQLQAQQAQQQQQAGGSGSDQPPTVGHNRTSISSIDFGPSCQLDQTVLYPNYDPDRRKSALGSPARRISGGSAVSGLISPRGGSPFTSPRGSNQWGGAGGSGRPSISEVSVSRRGSRLEAEIRETPQEEEAETEQQDKSATSTTTATSAKFQQHLTIPTKGMEQSSSAETLSGRSGRPKIFNLFIFDVLFLSSGR